MKKSLVALALFGAFAAQAQAQSAVVIYGTVDAGVSKTTGTTTAIGGRDNNKLGFKGTEDLGNGLKAIFQLEMRYTSDTGTLEGNGTRPLFQGQSTVGLQSDAFGTVRLGRALTATQQSLLAFEPWSGIPSKAGFNADVQMANYSSDPLLLGGPSTSKNRFANAVFYNSPVFSGFQVNGTVATKETATAAVTAPAVPYSLSATYNHSMFAVVGAYERNAIKDKVMNISASVTPIQNLKLMAGYTRFEQDSTIANDDAKSWLVGANYTMGPGKFLAGYGEKRPDNSVKTKQVSLGYEYSLSKRTYVYVDASHKKAPAAIAAVNDTTVNTYGVGVSHNF